MALLEGHTAGSTDPVLSKESEPEEVRNDANTKVVDIDLLGRYPKPFDVEPWVQCKVSDCNKWFKDKEIRTKHIAKYHT